MKQQLQTQQQRPHNPPPWQVREMTPNNLTLVRAEIDPDEMPIRSQIALVSSLCRMEKGVRLWPMSADDEADPQREGALELASLKDLLGVLRRVYKYDKRARPVWNFGANGDLSVNGRWVLRHASRWEADGKVMPKLGGLRDLTWDRICTCDGQDLAAGIRAAYKVRKEHPYVALSLTVGTLRLAPMERWGEKTAGRPIGVPVAGNGERTGRLGVFNVAELIRVVPALGIPGSRVRVSMSNGKPLRLEAPAASMTYWTAPRSH